ncbi:TIGR01777 family oxidoreductase [Iamia majanohamensis]|uniref:TIGR01777 family oxidoreductase n=1 Tax=Iamia majanohamensis TaxID=467976 RepID=A0AAE9Y7Q8_9ACTN|nr:TIGR01777 family oxidoreductase [Iamia majanohamensis]WCO68540.1 TIGR01777 family oxidoreductase [Iamia majanohamensis]
MRIAVTGSHGLIGGALVRSLEGDGHRVVRVVRGTPGPSEVRWDIDAGEIDTAGLEGLDGVVHLAGAGIASSRWTEEHKAAVLHSRSRGTALLSEALASLSEPPPVLVSGSAIGYYGDRGDEVLTEDSPPGEGFLPEVCLAWEAATGLAASAGIRVAHVRTGIVLSPDGGALGKQLLPFKLGLGGPAGAGHQWMPWISLDDEVAAIRFLLDHDVAGPVDLTAPHPVSNRVFAKTLGKVLHRPAVLPIPRAVTHLPLGVGALVENLLFSSARVLPAVLEEAGFSFRHETLEEALRDLLDRPA